MKSRASEFVDLLAQRHSGDVFIPEVLVGSAGDRRLDAWAMRKSWAHPHSFGYEVKVSRSDFIRDEKWRDYLAYCTDFYFVCPAGLIAPEELPPEAGLLMAAKTGTRLFVKKKAPTREVQVPETFYRAVLMGRVAITRETKKVADRDFWRRWMEEKELNHEFGFRVSSAIRRRVEQEVDKVRVENRKLREEIDTLAELRALLVKQGVEPGRLRWHARQRVEDLLNGTGLEQALRRAQEKIGEALGKIGTADDVEEGAA